MADHDILSVEGDEMVLNLAAELFIPQISGGDLLVNVHGRRIIPDEELDSYPFGGINVHPCLYKYKGAAPVSKLLKDKETLASVGVHRMTSKVDEGEVLCELFVDVTGLTTVIEVYNRLYPYYSLALLEALRCVGRGSMLPRENTPKSSSTPTLVTR